MFFDVCILAKTLVQLDTLESTNAVLVLRQDFFFLIQKLVVPLAKVDLELIDVLCCLGTTISDCLPCVQQI